MIHGKARGFFSRVLLLALKCLSVGYLLLHKLRYVFYRIGFFGKYRPPCPVVSVGNITCGGTGKTPMVHHLARWFAKHNLRVAILARGYGKIDDEGMELDLPEVRRFAEPNRKRLAKQVVSSYKPDVIILDDGFQHFAIDRNLDVVLVDAMNPFSNNSLIPAGLLRESKGALSRADIIAVTHADQVTKETLSSLKNELSLYNKPIILCGHSPVSLYGIQDGRDVRFETVKNSQSLAFCSIGNPDSFKKTLEFMGIGIAKFISYPDHHVFSPDEISAINTQSKEFMVDFLVTTEKDALKLKPKDFDLKLYVLRVQMKVAEGEGIVDTKLKELVQQKITTIKIT